MNILVYVSLLGCSAIFGVQEFCSFKEGMKLSPEFNKSTDIKWKVCESLYRENINNGKYHEKPLIPKIIHHIWLGSSFPEKYKTFRETWIKHHPDWTFYLWTDENIHELDLYNKEAFQKAKNYGVKSDILRYEVLYQYGGLYVDTDFECLKPFDIFHHMVSFYSGINYDYVPGMFNGLIACESQCPIIKECMISLNKNVDQFTRPIDIFRITGPGHFTTCFFKKYLEYPKPIALLPVVYFYPWPHFIKNPVDYHNFIQKESYAIHHWHVSWNK